MFFSLDKNGMLEVMGHLVVATIMGVYTYFEYDEAKKYVDKVNGIGQ